MTDSPEHRLQELRARLQEFVRERDWDQFHDAKNLAMCLASEAGELLAIYRWVSSSEADAVSHEPERRQEIAAELGDVGIAWLLLCERVGLDPLEVVESKLEANRRKYPVAKSRGRAEPPAAYRRERNKEG